VRKGSGKKKKQKGFHRHERHFTCSKGGGKIRQAPRGEHLIKGTIKKEKNKSLLDVGGPGGQDVHHAKNRLKVTLNGKWGILKENLSEKMSRGSICLGPGKMDPHWGIFTGEVAGISVTFTFKG